MSGEKDKLSANGARKVKLSRQNSECQPKLHTLYKSYLEVDHWDAWL